MSNNLYKAGLVAALFGVLAACGNADDHGHSHDGDADHAHEAAADDHGHAHDGEGHDHPHAEPAVATEAFYGDQADTPPEAAEPVDEAAADEHHDHDHDGETHEHKPHGHKH